MSIALRRDAAGSNSRNYEQQVSNRQDTASAGRGRDHWDGREVLAGPVHGDWELLGADRGAGGTEWDAAQFEFGLQHGFWEFSIWIGLGAFGAWGDAADFQGASTLC